MTTKIHVFYGAQYMGNETTIDDIDRVPDGAYVKMNGQWYLMNRTSLSRITTVDLPAEVLAQLCLLGENK